MELRHIRHALVLADAGSFRRAAAALRMAQPSLSESIRRLEAELGVQLFERRPTGVRPTARGSAFIVEARACLAAAARAAAAAAGPSRPEIPFPAR
jgi:DNA-binding transcriptional LysR family regulator